MRMELKDKYDDKGVSLHFYPNEWNCEKGMQICGVSARDKVLELIQDYAEAGISCFLQGNQSECMMIEFWTKDMDKIMEAVAMAEQIFGIEVE